MASLKDKVQNALDESRMLVLGAQVLVGFGFQSILEKSFNDLSPRLQLARTGSLSLLLLTLALLFAPAAYHQIVAKGEDSEQVMSFVNCVMCFALLPFAVALGLDSYVIIQKAAGPVVGVVCALILCGGALFFWYGLEALVRAATKSRHTEQAPMPDQDKNPPGPKSKLTDKIRHVLTEARMVLPGAQALLGFQFIAVFKEGFDKLPPASKDIHIASLVATGLSTILLMTPAAYHRLVEEGEETERFHRFATHMVLAAMAVMALGISGDFFVVVAKVTNSVLVAAFAAGAALTVFYGLWFGYTYFLRSQEADRIPRARATPEKVAS